MAFTTIQIRRDTAANWTSVNPVLHQGEFGFETDTGKLKVGDGTTTWNSLAYFSGSGAVTTTGSPASGNLTKFSGASSITNGDLSGDITTSGTLVTTVAKIAGTTVSGTTGSGNVVFSTSPTLVTPALGTPASGTLTNCTGLPVAGGGTGDSSFTTYAVICGGTTTTGALQSVASVGTSGQVLTSNGAGALPTFQTPGGGGSELVLLATATASSSASLDFTSDITSSYTEYRFVFQDILLSTTARFNFQASSNNGSTYALTVNGNYQDISGGTTTTASIAAGPPFNLMPTNAALTCNGYMTLINPTGTANNCVGYAFFNNNQVNDWFQDFILISSSGVGCNAVQFLPSAGTITSGKIYLYGIKNT